MSEDDGSALPPPLVLDASILIAIARADAGVTGLLMGYDASGQPLIMPALAIIAAMADMPGDDAEDALHGLEQLAGVKVAQIESVEEAAGIAAIAGRADLDLAGAHAAAVAQAEVCRILTLDAGKWRPHLHDLDEPLYIVEIADPEEEDS